MLSPGLVWTKSLKRAALFQTSSSSLPSTVGGFSKRGTTTGLSFSGGITSLGLPAGLSEAALDLLDEVSLVCANRHVPASTSAAPAVRTSLRFIKLFALPSGLVM